MPTKETLSPIRVFGGIAMAHAKKKCGLEDRQLLLVASGAAAEKAAVKAGRNRRKGVQGTALPVKSKIR